MARSRSLRQQAWSKCGGNCFLCGYPMLTEAEPGSPLLFTLEHIIPKCQGGTNDLENLSGSHFWCNNWKNGSLIEDLPSGWRTVLRWKIRNLMANRRVTT